MLKTYDKKVLRKEQDRIDENIKSIWGENCTLDGITNIDKYADENLLHVLWILKEPNRTNVQPTGIFNQREFHYNGAKSAVQTYNNILRVTCGINEYALNDKKYMVDDLPKFESHKGEDCKYYRTKEDGDVYPLEEIAFININKEIGGEKTNDNFIKDMYSRPEVKKVILDQVNYINPDIIIVCNQVEELLLDLSNCKSMDDFQQEEDKVKWIYTNDRLILSVGHPCRKATTSYCESILKVVYNQI